MCTDWILLMEVSGRCRLYVLKHTEPGDHTCLRRRHDASSYYLSVWCHGKYLKDDITSLTNIKHLPILPKRELRLRQAMSTDELSSDDFEISVAYNNKHSFT